MLPDVLGRLDGNLQRGAQHTLQQQQQEWDTFIMPAGLLRVPGELTDSSQHAAQHACSGKAGVSLGACMPPKTAERVEWLQLYSLPRCGGMGMVSFWCLHASMSCWPALGDEMQHVAQHGLQRQSK